jgi:hypothetical protein
MNEILFKIVGIDVISLLSKYNVIYIASFWISLKRKCRSERVACFLPIVKVVAHISVEG